MVRVTVVLDTHRVSISLPGIPRIGETIYVHGQRFEVAQVIYYENVKEPEIRMKAS